MPFVHGKNTAVIWKATDLSAYFSDSSTSRSVDVAETTTYGVSGSSKTYIVGHNDGTVSLSGLWDGAASAVDATLTATLGADGTHVATIAPAGLAIGSRVHMADVEQTSYEVSSPVADVVAISAELQATGGLDAGVSLHALASESTSTNSTSVDNAASSANGGVAHLHVTVNTRNGATTIKVQHSTDNSTWADLVTFASVSTSTTTSERVVVAAGTTVNRYLRAQSTVGGTTGALTYTVSFARR